MAAPNELAHIGWRLDILNEWKELQSSWINGTGYSEYILLEASPVQGNESSRQVYTIHCSSVPKELRQPNNFTRHLEGSICKVSKKMLDKHPAASLLDLFGPKREACIHRSVLKHDPTLAVPILANVDLVELNAQRSSHNIPGFLYLQTKYAASFTTFTTEAIKQGGMSPHLVVHVVKSLLGVVGRLHYVARVAHGDLKHSNLLLKDHTEQPVIVLCDFGSSSFLHQVPHDQWRENALPLSPDRHLFFHFPPEAERFHIQHLHTHGTLALPLRFCKHCRVEAQAADIWSLGYVLFDFLCRSQTEQATLRKALVRCITTTSTEERKAAHGRILSVANALLAPWISDADTDTASRTWMFHHKAHLVNLFHLDPAVRVRDFRGTLRETKVVAESHFEAFDKEELECPHNSSHGQ